MELQRSLCVSLLCVFSTFFLQNCGEANTVRGVTTEPSRVTDSQNTSTSPQTVVETEQNPGETPTQPAPPIIAVNPADPMNPAPPTVPVDPALPATPVNPVTPVPPSVPPTPVDNNNYIVNFATYDAVSAGQNITVDGGAIATGYYLLDNNPTMPLPKNFFGKDGVGILFESAFVNGNFQTYYDQGLLLPLPLIMNQIFMPTMMYPTGFIDRNGNKVLDQLNNPITQGFVLDIRGRLAIPAMGNYEVAIVTDDGVKMDLDNNGDGIYETSVINDPQFTRGSTLMCSSTVIQAIPGQSRRFRIQWHNGPGHLTLALMLRKLNNGELPGRDPLCGVVGNNVYFGPPTAPNYIPDFFNFGMGQLRNRGWFTPTPDMIKRP